MPFILSKILFLPHVLRNVHFTKTSSEPIHFCRGIPEILFLSVQKTFRRKGRERHKHVEKDVEKKLIDWF